jgi:hypothetical protein
MQLLNFTIGGQNIDLEWPNGGYADLHNNYKFHLLTYSPTETKLTLCWLKSLDDWAKEVTIERLELVFEKIDFLRIKTRDPAYPVSEDSCLQFICRTPQQARNEFENIYFNEDAQNNYDLTLFFQSEWGLKVHAETVYLRYI